MVSSTPSIANAAPGSLARSEPLDGSYGLQAEAPRLRPHGAFMQSFASAPACESQPVPGFGSFGASFAQVDGPAAGADPAGPPLSRPDRTVSLSSELLLTQQALQAINRTAHEVDFDRAYEGLRQAVTELLECEGCTLFLIDERTRQLWARLPAHTQFIKLPFGRGIVGSVAETGSCTNIPDAYGCKQFDPTTDNNSGFRTRNILCCPVFDVYGKRVAVIEALNKRGGAFGDLDEQMLQIFAIHLGNSLSLARLHVSAQTEQLRTSRLCENFRKLQSSTLCLDNLLNGILRAAADLVHAEHLLMLFFDPSNDRLWTRWYLGTVVDEQGICIHFRRLDTGLLGGVVQKKERVCVHDISAHAVTPGFADIVGTDRISSLLVQPVMDARNGRTIAVLAAVDKAQDQARALLFNDPVYTSSDEAALEVWAIEVAGILAGYSLEISFASALSGAVRGAEDLDHVLQAQLLSYVNLQCDAPTLATAASDALFPPDEESDSSLNGSWDANGLLESLGSTPCTSLSRDLGAWRPVLARHPSRREGIDRARSDTLDPVGAPPIRSARRSYELGRQHMHQELLRWDLDLCQQSHGDMLRFIFSIFASSGMAAAFSLEEGRLSRFIACVASNHHANPYHNLAHTCFVLQATHLVVHATKASGALPQTAHLALLLAALCHDLDHDGHTNSFHVASGSELARCYNDISVMENHHCAMAFSILDREDCGLLQHLDRSVQQEIRRLVIGSILATDISEHFSLTSKFWQHGTIWSPDNSDDCLLLVRAILHAADLSNPARPFPINAAMVQCLHTEFRAQAQEERELGLTPAPHMNASSEVVMCEMEASFIHAVALPLWEHLAACFPQLTCAVLRMELNYSLFTALSQLDEANILEVYKLSESDRMNDRLNAPRWMHGEGRWQIRAPDTPATDLRTNSMLRMKRTVNQDTSKMRSPFANG